MRLFGILAFRPPRPCGFGTVPRARARVGGKEETRELLL